MAVGTVGLLAVNRELRGTVRNRALWRLGPYMRPYLKLIVFVVASAIVSISASLMIPLIAKTMIDGPIADGNRGPLFWWFLLATGLAIFEASLTFIRRIALARISTAVEADIRGDLYAHLQRLDVGFHDRWESGQLLSRATTDLSILRRFAGFGAIFLVILTAEVLLIFGLLLSLHLWLGLMVVSISIPILLLTRKFMREYFTYVRRIQDLQGDLTTTIEEGAKGIRVLKAFGRGRHAYDRFNEQSTELYDTHIARIKLHTRFVWLLSAIPDFALAAILLAGAIAVGGGSLTIGGLVAFVTYVLILVWPIEALAWILALGEEAETAAGRVWEVFDTESTIDDRHGALAVDVATGSVRFDAVGFVYPYGERRVLDEVNLSIEPGETVALVGATGSGKTTIATLLARLYDPTEGAITLDGVDIRDLTVESLRRQIGFAFEEATLFSASVRENLLMGAPGATEADVEWALEAAQAGFAATLPWGLDTRIGEQGLTLSGGQRQRLALARAIISKPRLLILDDPLSALDVRTEARVEEALRPVMDQCTSLIVVHRPSSIAVADRVAFLHEGRIVDTGTHAELLARDSRYRSILSQEATVVDDDRADSVSTRGQT
jgi:ATP-binding cassette, subfamily B, bacterial